MISVLNPPPQCCKHNKNVCHAEIVQQDGIWKVGVYVEDRAKNESAMGSILELVMEMRRCELERGQRQYSDEFVAHLLMQLSRCWTFIKLTHDHHAPL